LILLDLVELLTQRRVLKAELDGLISQLDDGEEKKECVRALGNVVCIITQDFVFRVVRQYPELDPDRQGVRR
jgi:hypothetical protein